MNQDKLTIMVVEDEPLLLQAIKKKLELRGLEVLSCTEGNQAIDSLNSSPKLPDAIWLDYLLKDMNGVIFMEKLKQNEKWATIPVVVVSNSANPEKINKMLEFGVKQYILKAEHRLDDIIDIVSGLTNEK